MKEPDAFVSMDEFVHLITPLFLALHENGLISLQELAMRYEDALAKRRIDLKEPQERTDALQALTRWLHSFARRIPPPQA
jgi:hypothetical protein